MAGMSSGGGMSASGGAAGPSNAQGGTATSGFNVGNYYAAGTGPAFKLNANYLIVGVGILGTVWLLTRKKRK